jgi:hypothetical protein
MEQECESLIRSISQRDKNESMFSATGGRIWASCVSCPRVVVLVHLGWLAKKDADELREHNGFVSTVCGGCERNYGRTFREGQVGGISIQGEATEASPKYRAIANHCRPSGWEGLSIKSEQVLDRKALLQEHTSGITVRSVEVTCGEDGWAVRMLDYVEIDFLRVGSGEAELRDKVLSEVRNDVREG